MSPLGKFFGCVILVILVLMTSCSPFSQERNTEPIIKLLIDTLGVTLESVEYPRTNENVDHNKIYRYTDEWRSIEIKGNPSFVKLASNHVYENGVFKYEPVTMIDSVIIFSFRQPCCAHASAFDRRYCGGKEEILLETDKHFGFIDKDRKVLVGAFVRHEWDEWFATDTMYYDIWFYSIHERKELKNFQIVSLGWIYDDYSGEGTPEYEGINIIFDSLKTLE